MQYFTPKENLKNTDTLAKFVKRNRLCHKTLIFKSNHYMHNIFEIEGMKYVTFLKKGLQFDKRIDRPHKSEFINFIKTENGEKIIYSESLEKQLIKIKERIEYSIELLLRNYIFEDDKKKKLLNLIDDLKDSKKSSEIITIIEKGLILTDKFK